jgi:hypothetical protein
MIGTGPNTGVLRTGATGFVVGAAREGMAGAADCLQRPVCRRSACSIPIADGQDAEDILGSTAYLTLNGPGDKSLPRMERGR